MKPLRLSNFKLWNELCKSRTVHEAKKRFIWMPRVSAETALVCYLAGNDEDEDLAMIRFFDRHANQDIFFFDDTTMTKNIWESEFHLSFFQIVMGKSQAASGIPTVESEIELPGKSDKKLTRAAMGFRIFGDFFDRYWTCHYIEHLPSSLSSKNESLDLNPTEKTRSWSQRKVLALRLVNRMLTKVTQSTHEILDEIYRQLRFDPDDGATFTALNSEDYFKLRVDVRILSRKHPSQMRPLISLLPRHILEVHICWNTIVAPQSLPHRAKLTPKII
jgi:hypothetical protein